MIRRPLLTGADGVETLPAELASLFRLERSYRRGPATVFVVWDLEEDRRVALRVIPFERSGRSGAEEELHRAVAALAVLDHPHVVPVYRSGSTARFLWYSQQHVQASSLIETLAAGGAMELQPCLRILQQVASALHYAHGRGIVHGDLTPASVLLDAAGWALVTDFKVGRVFNDLGTPEGVGLDPRWLAYHAPERLSARQLSPHADQYSLAVLAFECLSGTSLRGTSLESESRPRLHDVRPGVAAHVSAAVERALTKTPGRRFASVLEFVAALEGGSPAPRSNAASPRGAQKQYPVLFIESPPIVRRRTLVTTALVGLAGALTLWLVGAWPSLESVGPAQSAHAVPAPELATDTPDSAAFRAAAPGARAPAQPRRPVRAASPSAAGAQPDRWAPLPGRLFISAVPWGQLYVDDSLVGNTPKADVPITPGLRRVRVTREGFASFERTIYVAPGQQVRLTNIILQELQR